MGNSATYKVSKCSVVIITTSTVMIIVASLHICRKKNMWMNMKNKIIFRTAFLSSFGVFGNRLDCQMVVNHGIRDKLPLSTKCFTEGRYFILTLWLRLAFNKPIRSQIRLISFALLPITPTPKLIHNTENEPSYVPTVNHHQNPQHPKPHYTIYT